MQFNIFKTTAIFLSKKDTLDQNSINFIEDTKQIYVNGIFYAGEQLLSVGTMDALGAITVNVPYTHFYLWAETILSDFEKINKNAKFIPVNSFKTNWTLAVYNNENKVGFIDITLKNQEDTPLYSFGILSDIHNEKDSDHTEQSNTESGPDFINALTYFDGDESIDFTVICGDVTQVYGNPSGWSYSDSKFQEELQIYQQNIETASPRTPVYTTTGNHDCPQSGNIDINIFKQYTNSEVPTTAWNGNSFEINKERTDGKIDHFLFLGMNRYNFTQCYLESDITWLSNKLEEYKNDRCFIITHLFFPDRAGNFKQLYTNSNWLSGTQLTTLQGLCDQYKNTIWFSGHSHWKWQLQQYEDKANIWPITNEARNSGWCVHIPSCASPIDSDGTSTRVSKAKESQGGIVRVYSDYIEIQGISFKGTEDTTYNTKFIPMARYRLESTPGEINTELFTLCTAEHIKKNLQKYPTGEDASTYNIQVTQENSDTIISFTLPQSSSGILITPTEDITKDTNTVMIHFDEIKFMNSFGTVIETPENVGFYTEESTYSVENNLSFSASLSNGGGDNTVKYGVQFQTRSSYSGTKPLKVQFKNLKYKVIQ